MKSPNQYLLLLEAVVVYVVVNLILGSIPAQWDMTASREHSVSDATREKLHNLPSPVTIRYYASVSENSIPYSLRVYGEKVEYFLDILEREGQGEVEVVRYDPKPGSDAEEMAKFDSMTSNFNRDQGRFYFGLSVSSLDRKVKIPFLHPDREELLEYDILQAIDSVANQNRKTIGIISSLPVMGGEYSNERGKGVSPPWLFVKELQKSYKIASYMEDIKALETAPPDLLIVLHPVGLDESYSRHIDQYLANGGKAVVCLDPFSGAIGMINPSFQKDLMGSNFEKLLSAWGVNFHPLEVVADMNLRSEVDRGFGPEKMHTVLDIPQRFIHSEDPITAGINTLGFPYAGHFWPEASMAKRLVPLVSTSKAVSTVTPDQLFRAGREKNDELLKSFEPDGHRRVIVAKLLGALPPAYPDTVSKIKAGPDSCQVVLFADADFVFDPFAGETVQLSKSQATLKPYNGNLALLSNSVDYLIGEEGMLTARGKGAVRYPLTGLSDLMLETEDQYKTRRQEIQTRQLEIEKKLDANSEEEKNRDTTKFIADKKAFNQLMAERDQTEEELAGIKREIDYKLQQVKNRYQWANTLSMPLVILLVGAIVIYRRNSHSRAR